MANWLEGIVIENIRWTQNLFSLKIEADINEFSAGQFITLALDLNGKRISRPYSVLSPPGERPLEFYFYTLIDGKLSNALLGLNPEDSVWVEQKPNGFFTLNEVPSSKHLWMICTGTGIAPFLSILKTEEVWKKYQHLILVQGIRSGADLLYQNLIEEFISRYPSQFTFKASVTREQLADTIHGRIPQGIKDGTLEHEVGLELSIEDSQIMLCGNPAMTRASIEVLKEKGLTRNRRRTPGQITVENYWSA